MTFEEFVDWMELASSTCLHPVPHRYQLDWFTDPSGKVIVDFIGRFEKLEQDWAFVALNLGITQSLPHENRNTRRKRHYTEYYTSETRAKIEERFRVDIEYFGYDFEGTACPKAIHLEAPAVQRFSLCNPAIVVTGRSPHLQR